MNFPKLLFLGINGTKLLLSRINGLISRTQLSNSFITHCGDNTSAFGMLQKEAIA